LRLPRPADGRPAELARWFTLGADRKSLELYLEGFRHTIALLQTRDAIERVAAECVEDLAADNVVYAEVRYRPSSPRRAA
jgi:adenosine deaminase